MTLPLWGMMQKAQDDPETIEQAIARMIAEHEADPEAHLGEGESLSMHKHEEVIDHPAFSIVGDKFSNTDIIINTPIQSNDALAAGSNGSPLNMRYIVAGDFDDDLVRYGAFLPPSYHFADRLADDFIIRGTIGADWYGGDGFVQFGMLRVQNANSTTKILNGFYFSIEDGGVFARVHSPTFDDYELVLTEKETYDSQTWEIENRASEDLLIFRINGVEVWTCSTATLGQTYTTPYIFFRSYAPTEGEGGGLALYNIFWTIHPPAP